jgi:tetratricopeptide (TPR) repeat protein
MQHSKAVKIYKQILQALLFCETSDNEEESEIKALKVQIMTNIVKCYNLQEKAKEALAFIAKIEQSYDIGQNSKLLFAKGKALRLQGDFKGSLTALTMAFKLHPTNKVIINELIMLENGMEKYKKTEEHLKGWKFD